jgi:hypothetical protein
VISLLSFLPDGFIFSPEDKFVANMPFHEIKYNKNLLDSKYFPLMIFHEI